MTEIEALSIKNKINKVLNECDDETVIDVCKRIVLSYVSHLELPCLDTSLQKLKNAHSLHEVRESIKSICQILGSVHKFY